MEQDIVIIIGMYKSLGIIGTIIAGAWYISHRLTKVETNVSGFDKRLTSLEGRLDNAFSGSSPLSLLPKGEAILEESGLKKHIEDNKDQFIEHCGKRRKTSNSYDIQSFAFNFFDEMKFEKELELKLKTTAFSHGVNIKTVRRVGGIHFRDICLQKFGFKLEDLDKSSSQ